MSSFGQFFDSEMSIFRRVSWQPVDTRGSGHTGADFYVRRGNTARVVVLDPVRNVGIPRVVGQLKWWFPPLALSRSRSLRLWAVLLHTILSMMNKKIVSRLLAIKRKTLFLKIELNAFSNRGYIYGHFEKIIIQISRKLTKW